MEEFNQIYTEITTKKYRTYNPVVEELMLKFVQLGAEVVKYPQVKELLVNYKIICQNTQLPSIQKVFEAAIKEAKSKTTPLLGGKELFQTEDLDIPFSDSSAEYRYLRYEWEILKCMLDVLKNNNKFEDLFLIVAQEAFDFCISFDRKAEFKRLGDFLRSSLNNMIKSSASVASGSNRSYFAINLAQIQSSTVQLEVRMQQLSASVRLNCWVEAYRILDDLQSLFNVAKKCLAPECLLKYFSLVSTVLSVAPDASYQIPTCASLLKALGIVVGNGLLQQAKQQVAELCDRIMISYLSIPIFAPQSKLEEDERMQKILLFLGIASLPTREQLCKEIVSIRGNFIGQHAANPTLLEYVSGKRELDVQLISQIPKENAPFIQSNISTLKAKSLLSTSIGSAISLQKVKKHFPEFSHSSLALEKFMINCCIGIFNIQPLIDQESGTISIVKDLNLFLLSNSLMEPISTTKEVSPLPPLESFRQERQEKLSRCKRIEERKEKKEQLEAQKEQEAYRLLTERLEAEQEAEKARLQEESHKREAERLKREKEAIERDELKKLIDEFLAKSKEAGKKFTIKLSECPSKKDFLIKQMRLLQQDKQETESKACQISKRLEYTDRAIRKESNPILKEKQAVYLKERSENAQLIVQTRYEKALAKFNVKLEQKERITPYVDAFCQFKSALIQKEQAAEAERQAKLREQELALQEEMRAKALLDRPLHAQFEQVISTENVPRPFAFKKSTSEAAIVATSNNQEEEEIKESKPEAQIPIKEEAQVNKPYVPPSSFASKAAANSTFSVSAAVAVQSSSPAFSSSITTQSKSTTSSFNPQDVPQPFLQRSKFQTNQNESMLFAERMASFAENPRISPSENPSNSSVSAAAVDTPQPQEPSQHAPYKFVSKKSYVTTSSTNSINSNAQLIPTPFKK